MQNYNEAKFAELLIYVAAKCGSRHFREVRVEKVLSYADFLAYKTMGKSITGAAYVALEHGPTPQCLIEVRERLEADRAIAIDRRERPARLVALRAADLTQFTAAEIALIDGVIDTLHQPQGNEAGEPFPALLGWKAARAETAITGNLVIIPYSTVFVSNTPLDEFEQILGLELAKKHGWAI